MRNLIRLLCGLVLLCSWSIGMAGDFALFGGKMLNNARYGQSALVGGVEVSHFWGAHGARFNYQRVTETEIAEDMAYSTLSVIQRHGRFVFGVGIVSQMSYSTAGWWEGKHYPNDGVHFSKSCRWCGSSYSVDWAVTERWAVRASYVAQNRLEPTYNGLTVGAVLTL